MKAIAAILVLALAAPAAADAPRCTRGELIELLADLVKPPQPVEPRESAECECRRERSCEISFDDLYFGNYYESSAYHECLAANLKEREAEAAKARAESEARARARVELARACGVAPPEPDYGTFMWESEPGNNIIIMPGHREP